MIEISDVSFLYEGQSEPAVSHVTLTVRDGEFVAICGHNGSGKSTLSKMLNALLLPTEGMVTVDGIDTRDETRLIDLRRRVGMVFQNPDNQLVTSIVEEDVAFGPENLGIEPKEIRSRVDAALREVNMTDFAESASHTLSGGQKQRIAIAGMLAMRPDILVLDEATAMLDPMGRREVLETVRRLNREYGMTVVMITQYMEEAIGADRMFVLSGGKLLTEGTPREVFADRALLSANRLDVPLGIRVRDTLRDAGIPLPGEPMTIEELSEAIWQSLSNN